MGSKAMKERNMLFGLLAVRDRKIPLDRLAEVAGQTASAEKDLGSLLVAAGTISEADRKALEQTVDEIIEETGTLHGALQKLNADEEALRSMGESLYGDSSIAETLGLMATSATQMDTVQGATPGERSHMATIVTAADSSTTGVPTIEGSAMDHRSHMETIASVPEGDRSGMATIATAPTGMRSEMQTIASEASQMGTGTGATVAMRRSPADGVTLADLHGGPGGGGSGQAVPAVREHPGRYRAIKTLAQGGMGQIDIVHDKHLGREIALKTLLPGRVSGATVSRTKEGAPTMDLLTVPIIARFLQEAHVTGQLEHPGIIPIYEMGYRDDGTLYYTMKLVKGQSIQDKLKECKDLKDRLQILTHFLDICQAIAYAHSRGVIHRDLKPMNVMIGEFGETTVIDWGIAKVQGERDIHEQGMRETVKKMEAGGTQASVQTMDGATMGSPYYMPPEQAAGRTKEINERADIYALGAILYVILAGVPPYHGMNVREFLAKVAAFPPKPVLEVEPTAPKELAAVVAKAMAHDAKDRYQTASELAEEVQNYLSGGLVSAYDYNFSELLRRFYKKHKRLIQLGSASALALMVFAIAYLFTVTYYLRQEQVLRGEADVARGIAEEQRGIAVANEQEAVRQKGIAETNEQRAERELYFAKVGLAAGSIEERQIGKARAQLATAPAENRNWEWGRLQQAMHTDLMTIKGGGQITGYGNGIIVAGQAQGGIDVTNDQTGERLHRLIELTGTGYAFDFSPSSNRIALLEQTGAHVWDAVSGEKIYHYEDPVEAGRVVVRQASMSADGARYAMLNRDNTVRVVELPGGAELFTAPLRQAAGMSVVLSPDGSRLLTIGQVLGDAGVEVRFEVWDLADNTSIGSAQVPENFPVNAAAFSADNAHVAMAGEAVGVQVWRLDPFEKADELPGRYNVPRTAVFSPDGTRLITGTRDGDIHVLDIATGAKTALMKAHGDQIRSVAFDATGTRVVSASLDRSAKLWEFRGADQAALVPIAEFIGHDEELFDATFSPDGARMVTTSRDRRTKVWDLLAEMELAPASNVVYDQQNGLVAGALGGTAVVWDAATGHRVATLEGHAAGIDMLAFSPASKHLAALGGEKGAKQIIVWNIADGTEAGRQPVADGASRIALSHSGARAAVVLGKTISIMTFDGAAPFESPIAGGIALDGEHRLIAFASPSDSGTEREYDLNVVNFNTSVPVTKRSLGETWAVSLAFNPAASYVAAGLWLKDGAENDLRLTLVPIADGAAEQSIATGHGNEIIAIAFSRDGGLVATGSKDTDIRIFDAATGESRAHIQGHADVVQSLDFSADGARIASASLDGTFMLWNTATGIPEPEVLLLHNQAQTAAGQVIRPDTVRFSADGTSLATLTSGAAVPPYVLRTFPWTEVPAASEGQTPEEYDEALLEHMEAHKRSLWQGK